MKINVFFSNLNNVYLLLKAGSLNDHPDRSRRPHVDQFCVSRNALTVDGHPAEVVSVSAAERFQVSLQQQQRALDPDQGFVSAAGQVSRGCLQTLHASDQEFFALQLKKNHDKFDRSTEKQFCLLTDKTILSKISLSIYDSKSKACVKSQTTNKTCFRQQLVKYK
jgi:hypothetical protein